MGRKTHDSMRGHNTVDHSKWAVTGKSSEHWTCIGNINRTVYLYFKHYNMKKFLILFNIKI